MLCFYQNGNGVWFVSSAENIFIKFINLTFLCVFNWGFPGGSDSKESAYNARDLGLIPGSGRSPGEGNL